MRGSLVVLSGGDSGISLLDEGQSLSVELGELDELLLALTDGEHVGETGGERVAVLVSDVHNLVRTRVVLHR